MRLRRRMRVDVLLGVVVLGACDMTEPRPFVSVGAMAERTQVRVGDKAVVIAEIANYGGASAHVSGSLPSFLEVRDASNRIVFFGRSGNFALAAYPPQEIAPGERITDSPFWATAIIGGGGDGSAPPGTYRVRAAVMVLEGGRGNILTRPRSYVYSEPLDITVTP